MFNRKSSGILGRQVEPDDDGLCMDAGEPSAGPHAEQMAASPWVVAIVRDASIRDAPPDEAQI
jgi:hypothetical protein